jgi:enoyl-CoA hydratase/carnithine racemase
MHAWLDLLVRLSRAPAVSTSIRGRVRGAGSEFVLACDLRSASRDNSLLGQFEVGAGVVPGGGPTARLPRLVGRGRALEILLVAEISTDRAQSCTAMSTGKTRKQPKGDPRGAA